MYLEGNYSSELDQNKPDKCLSKQVSHNNTIGMNNSKYLKELSSQRIISCKNI